MKENVISEINQMKYLFGYKAGKVISEQVQPTNNKIVYTDNFGNEFESGKYSFNPQYSKVVNEKIVKIADYIKDKNLKDFKLVISSGESQVPNQPPFDKEKGSLAKKRAEVLKAYLEQALIPTLPVKPVIEIKEPIIGNTVWDPKKGKDAEEYKKEQFVNASVELTSEIPQPPPPEIKPEKTSFMISWTLDNRCDRIKYFKTFEEMDAVKKKFESNPRFRAAYYETRGVPPTEAVLKLGYLQGDPTSDFFEGPFFNNCTQKFEERV